MRARGTLVLFLLAALAGGYALLIERHRPTEEEREEKARVILDLDPAAITEIRLAWAESSLTLVRDPSRNWHLIEPHAAIADERAATALAEVFNELEAERWLQASEVDTAATGLADPWVRATVSTADSVRTAHYELAVGNLNPTRSAYFARLDSDLRIALLSSWLVDSNFKRSFSDLRDKRLARFDPEAARRIELITPDRRLVITAEDGTWRIADPPLRADETAVRSLLDRIASLEATRFVIEGKEDASQLVAHGLARPHLTAAIRGDHDSLLAQVEIGTPAAGGTYARAFGPGRGQIVMVPAEATDELAPDIEELRDRRLVDLGASEIDTLRVIAGSKIAVLARDSTGAFQRAGGVSDPEADRVAAALPHLRVARFVDERVAGPAELRRYGLDAPSLRLELRLRNGERREVAFGHTQGDGVFAFRTGDPGVVTISESAVSDLRRLAVPQ